MLIVIAAAAHPTRPVPVATKAPACVRALVSTSECNKNHIASSFGFRIITVANNNQLLPINDGRRKNILCMYTAPGPYGFIPTLLACLLACWLQ
jgi:hypothetical protein